LVRGEDTRWVERGWGVNSSEDARHCSVLYICKYFVVLAFKHIYCCSDHTEVRVVRQPHPGPVHPAGGGPTLARQVPHVRRLPPAPQATNQSETREDDFRT
jgi:hypothetical protein